MIEITDFTRVTLIVKDMCLPFHLANLFNSRNHVLPKIFSSMVSAYFYTQICKEDFSEFIV